MRPEARTLFASAVLHLLLVGGGLALARQLRPPAPPLDLDLAILREGAPGAASPVPPGLGAAPGAATTAPAAPSAQASFSSASAAPAAAPGPGPGNEGTSALSAGETGTGTGQAPGTGSGTASGADTGQASGTVTGQAFGTGTGQAPGIGIGQASGTSSGADPSRPPGSNAGLEVLRAIYLQEHFSYIRDRIASLLVYPRQAVKAGWSGKVSVLFRIQEDGHVDEVRIAKGSGIPLLDRDAEETVLRAAPFPRPRVSAHLVIPVEYRLD